MSPIDRKQQVTSQQQQESSQIVYIFNSHTTVNGVEDMTSGGTANDNYYELTQVQCRPRNSRKWSEEDSTVHGNMLKQQLYGKKDEIVYIDLKDGDTLQKLALMFHCNVAEIKLANKIYSEQDLHALKTVKIPVIKDGVLHEKYTEKDTSASTLPKSNEVAIKTNFDNSNTFAVQKTEVTINGGLDFLSGTSSSDDEDIFDARDTQALLRDDPLERDSSGRVARDQHDTNINEYLEQMDAHIERTTDDADKHTETLQEVTQSISTGFVIPPGQKKPVEVLGSVASYTWSQCLCFLLFVAVVCPVIGFLLYEYKFKNHHS